MSNKIIESILQKADLVFCSAAKILNTNKRQLNAIEKFRRKKLANELLQDRAKKQQKDSITNMQSCNSFDKNLNKTIKQEKDREGIFGVLCIDVNSFHRINQRFGFNEGDKVITEIGQRLTRVMGFDVYGGERQIHLSITRLKGNTFAVLVPVIFDEDEVERMADKFMIELCKPINVEDKEICLSLSIGSSIFPFDAESGDGLLLNALIANKKAKQLGDNKVIRYDGLESAELEKSEQIKKDIITGIKNCEFEVYYQPIFKRSEITGAEALLRWKKNDVGVSPDRFIPIAEKNGLINALGEIAIKGACSSAQKWIEAGIVSDDFKVAVNISVNELESGDLFLLLKECLRKAKLPSKNLQIEISEKTFVNKAAIGKEIDRIADHGISVLFDDFGTGQACIAHLQDKNIKGFKIDKSFIQTKNQNTMASDMRLLEMFVAIAKAMNMELTALGVETAFQEQLVSNLGIEYTQGFLKGKPLSKDAFSVFALKTKSASEAKNQITNSSNKPSKETTTGTAMQKVG